MSTGTGRRVDRWLRVGVWLFALFILAIGAPRSEAQAADRDAAQCAALTALSAPPLAITEARWVRAGPLPALPVLGPGARAVAGPAHCLVRGVLDPRIGVGGRKYGLGFELRMPDKWNGRFLFQGGGGLDGAVLPAIGTVAADDRPALVRGFAVISSDGGHEGRDAGFATDQQARLDYAYAGLGPIAALGKQIIARYYGRGPRDSYFVGCSNGGREAMMVAERFPDLFNGIVAGDPGFNLSRAAIAEMWNVKHLMAIAPKDAQGRPILADALTQDDLELLSKAVLKSCDALDGLRDGMIDNVAACHFDPRPLVCRPAQQRGCLSADKVAAIEALFSGPHDSSGRPLYAGWPYDAGLATLGWRFWKLGTSQSAVPNGLDATLGVMAMRYYFLTPPDPAVTPMTFDFDRALQATAQTAAINDATGTFFSTFIAHGGKLIIYHDMSDPVFSPDAIIGWYRKLMRQYKAPQSWARLFLVPGMNHCGGGPATDQFDALTAIGQWVEDNREPDRIVAHGKAFPGVTRPLCPYPQFAAYRSGPASSAASFVCAAVLAP